MAILGTNGSLMKGDGGDTPISIASAEDRPSPPQLFEQLANAVIHGELLYHDGKPDDFRFVYVNPALRNISGLPPTAPVEGKYLSDFLPEARVSRQSSLILHERVLRTGISESYEQFIPSRDGWYSVQVFRVDENHFLAIFSDVTARKTAEQMLVRTQKMLREALGIARVGCWQLDLGSLEFTFADGMRELFEIHDEEVLDRYICAERVHPDDQPQIDAAFEAAIKTGSLLQCRHRTIGRDGSLRYFQVSGKIDRSADGRLRLIGTTQDVTDMVRQESALRESERRLTATIEASPVPLALNDSHGRVIYLNAAFRRCFGYELSDIPTLDHWWPLAYPDREYRDRVQQDWHARLDATCASGTPFDPLEAVVRTKDGSYRTVIATATSVEPGADGLHLIELYDITERKQLEERLHQQSAYLQSVIDASPTALAMFDADRRLIGVNRQFHEIHDIGPDQAFRPGEAMFDDILRYFHARGDFPGSSEEAFVERCVAYMERRERINFERRTSHGRVLEMDGIPLESGGTLLSYKDVTDRAQKLDDARTAALHDPLTLLPNRRALEAHYGSMIADRSTSRSFGALLLIDLDRFKAVNDSLGHIYGDLLLINVADRLRTCVRSSDLVVRLGGDEFVVLLGEIAASHAEAKLAAERIAEHIRAALSEPYRLRPTTEGNGISDECVYRCSASIGGWILPHEPSTLTNAIQKADDALYVSKRRGRNAIVIH